MQNPKTRFADWALLRICMGRVEGATLAVLAVIAASAFLLQRLISRVIEGETLAFDQAILIHLRTDSDLSVPIGPALLTHAMMDITTLGGVTVLSLVTALATVYLTLRRQLPVAVFLVCSVLGGLAVSTTLKLTIARARPDVVPHLVTVSDLSFPSGHAMLSAVTYLTLGALLARAQQTRSTRAFVVATGVFLTFLIGLSRIYLGVHYPTDVFAGWSAGASWAAGCWMLSLRFISRSPSERSMREI